MATANTMQGKTESLVGVNAYELPLSWTQAGNEGQQSMTRRAAAKYNIPIVSSFCGCKMKVRIK